MSNEELIAEARRQAQSPWDEPWKDMLRDLAVALEAAERVMNGYDRTPAEARAHAAEEQLAAAQAAIQRVLNLIGDIGPEARRILTQSPTDALEAAKAAAWDEGYTRGFYDREMLHGEVRDASEGASDNPYRAASIVPGEVESRGE